VILACVLVFIWQSGLPAPAEEQAVYALGLIPATLFGKAALAPDVYLLPPAATLVTSTFLHGGFAHLFGNMLYLYIFGDNVEDSMGHGRYLVFYLLCGALASAAHAVSQPASPAPLIGASGAIAGVLGAYLVQHPRSRILVLTPWVIPLRLPAWMMLVAWFAFQVLSTGSPADEEQGTAWWAHIGGFLAGIVLLPFFRRQDVRLLR
jgi:membrane associated rhomboid family serine protease